MRILYVTSKPIFPLADGGNIASWNLLKNMLHLGFNVKNLTVETGKHPFDLEAYPASLQQIISPEAVFVDTAVRAKDAFLSLFSSRSYNVSRFYSQAFEKAIADEVKASDYGLIVLENVYTLPYLGAIRKHYSGKVIVRPHNVEYRIWERLAQEEKNPLKRIFLKKLAKDLQKYEMQHLPKTDGIACISDDDQRHFKSMGFRVPMRTIPVSMELPENKSFDFETLNEGKHDLFFLGAMNWQPNIEAVDFLLKEIFPAILKQLPQAKLHLAGSYMPENLEKLQQPNVIVHGKVESVHDFMTANGILLVPMKSGSGIRIKILEALSMGIPVVSTSVGFEGIPVQHEIHGLKAETAESLVQAAIRLSKDPALAAKLGKAGQQMVLNTYSPENVSRQFLEFIQSI